MVYIKKNNLRLLFFVLWFDLLVLTNNAYPQNKIITPDEKMIYKFVNNYLSYTVRSPTNVCQYTLKLDFIFVDTLFQEKIKKYFTSEDIDYMQQQYKSANLKVWDTEFINAKLTKNISRRKCTNKKKFGCYCLSIPLFSMDKSKAFIYVFYTDGFHAQQKQIMFYEKKSDIWVFQEYIMNEVGHS
jgi:hypothetical protein